MGPYTQHVAFHWQIILAAVPLSLATRSCLANVATAETITPWTDEGAMYTGRVSRRRYLSLVLLSAGVTLTPASGHAQAVVAAWLENGLRVLLEEDHRSPIASIQVWYRVGSRDERIGQSGLSHYLEHMMFKGTPANGPRVFSQRVEGVGGQGNAVTSRDVTAYHVTIAAEQLDLVLELEADRMRNLLLDPQEVDAERKVVLEERRTRSEDDPAGALAEIFQSVAFVIHPYRLPIIGFTQDIERLTTSDHRAWYDIYYRPNNAILAAVGDFNATETLERIRSRFGSIPRADDPARVAVAEPDQRGERRVWLRREAQLPLVLIGYPTPNYRSNDAFALEVLSVLLSGGRTSRLYQRLVYEARLALEAGGDYSRLNLDPDMFTFHMTVLPDRSAEEAERALLSEVERLRTELVAEDELQRAKSQIEAVYFFGQDAVQVRAATLARYELLGDWQLRDTYLPGIRAVTSEDVRRAAERYFVADRRTTAILIPTRSGATPP
jgi:zinc protease